MRIDVITMKGNEFQFYSDKKTLSGHLFEILLNSTIEGQIQTFSQYFPKLTYVE